MLALVLLYSAGPTNIKSQRKIRKEPHMDPVSRDEITKRLEALKPGEKLRMLTSPTFGDMTIIFELNPAWPNKHQKKFLLWVGKTEDIARKSKPFNQSDKAKKLAGWAADRWPQWLPEETPAEKAA